MFYKTTIQSHKKRTISNKFRLELKVSVTLLHLLHGLFVRLDKIIYHCVLSYNLSLMLLLNRFSSLTPSLWGRWCWSLLRTWGPRCAGPLFRPSRWSSSTSARRWRRTQTHWSRSFYRSLRTQTNSSGIWSVSHVSSSQVYSRNMTVNEYFLGLTPRKPWTWWQRTSVCTRSSPWW